MNLTDIERDLSMSDRNEERSVPRIDFTDVVHALWKVHKDIDVQPDREHVYGREALMRFAPTAGDTWTASIWLSHLSPYAAIVWKRLDAKGVTIVSERELPEAQAASHQTFKALMERETCRIISEDLLYKPLSSRRSAAGQPVVTVFSALFSAI